MIKFVLSTRRRQGDTQERFFYEWGNIHVALMLTTRSVMKTFRRYVQHFSVSDAPSAALWHPLSPMNWDNFAEHWLQRIEDLGAVLQSPDYVARMQPHSFSDGNFVIELLSAGETLFEAENFRSGGIKLINFLRRKPDLSQTDFESALRNEHGPLVVRELSKLKGFQKCVQSFRLPLDPGMFRGTLFEAGGVGQHAAIEEYWFDSMANLAALGDTPAVLNAIRQSDGRIVEATKSFSVVAKERVIFDFESPGSISPVPAILTDGSLESAVDAQGYSGWNLVPTP